MRFPFAGRFRPESASTQSAPASASSPPDESPDIPWPSRRAWAYGPPHPPAVRPAPPPPPSLSVSQPQRREIPRSLVAGAISLVAAAGVITAALAFRPSTGHAVNSRVTTTATVATSSSTASGPAQVYALDALAKIQVQNEHVDGYDASLFPTAQATANGCDISAQVLMRDNHGHGPNDGCTVVAGSWTSPYDGVVTTNADALVLDHVVSLKEAWDSGAWSWDPARRAAFATDLTDPRTLRAVTSSTNRSKGDNDPATWIPPAKADECSYLGDWIAIKARWGLSMDKLEAGRIRDLLDNDCAGLNIARWPAVPTLQPVVAATTTTIAPTTTVAPTTTTSTTVEAAHATKKKTTTTVQAPDDAPATSSTAAPTPAVAPTTSPTTAPVRQAAPTTPTTTTAQPTTTTVTAPVAEITPGAFCAPVGAHGTYHGESYVCSLTNAAGQPYAGGQPHWRQG